MLDILNIGSETVFLNDVDLRLTGNFKILVDSNNDLYLSSINPLSDGGLFKRYPIDVTKPFDQVLYEYSTQYFSIDKDIFWKFNGTASIKHNISALESSFFGETYSSFTTLALSKDSLPDYFIIFRVPATNRTILFDDFYGSGGDLSRLMYSEIVYACNLNNGKISEFLTNLNSNIPNRLIRYTKEYGTDLEQGAYIYGINPYAGVFTKKYIILKKDTENILTDIKDRFVSLRLVSSNIFNFEFLFDSNYTNPNEFFGLYFYKEDLEDFNIDIGKYNQKTEYPVVYDNYANLDNSKFTLSSDEVYIETDSSLSSCFDDLTDCSLNVIKDKTGFLYNALSYSDSTLVDKNKSIILSGTQYNLANLIGKKEYEGLQIFGYISDVPGYSNLKLSLYRTDKRSIFNSGDYISVTCGGDMYEWRLICNPEVCCSDVKWCHYDGVNLKFRSVDFSYTKSSDSVIMDIIFDKLYPFIEGETVYISHSFLDRQQYTIDKLYFNHNENTTTITVIDQFGNLLNRIDDVEFLILDYKEKSYYYTNFDSIGSTEEVARKIVKAFRLFPNILFDATYLGNDIILRSKYPGDIYSKFKLSYNLAVSPTPLANLEINEVPLSGTDLLDSNGELIFNRKRGITEFYGENDGVHKTRFYVNKEWGLANITGDELIETKQGFIKLKTFLVEKNKISYGNYIDRPVIRYGKIVDYFGINDYFVYQIKDVQDDIIPGTDGAIGVGYKFRPSLLKLECVSNDRL